MTQVKICGIRLVAHGLAAAEAGANMLGFVFAPSRRRLEPEAAQEIIRRVREQSPAVQMVGLFVDERPEEINRVVALCDLDLIQLGGDEPDQIVAQLRVPVIRTVHVFPHMSRDKVAGRVNSVSGGIVLLDTGKAGSRGGTGQSFDWTVVPALDRPMLLAGGLTADNVRDAVRTTHPWGVDVSSGVERDGDKDVELIRAFIHAATDVDAE